jgi:hypothetical protein
MKSSLSVLLLLSLAGNFSHAQTPTPPPDPQIAALPANVVYRKSYTYPPNAPDENLGAEEKALRQFKASFPKTEQLEVTKTGQIRREIEHMTDGSDLERWKSGEFSFFTSTSLPGQILVSAPGMTPTDNPIDIGNKSDFAELAWINRNSFRGEETRQGSTYYVYREGGRLAWIASSTKLPVYFESPELKISYTYEPPPAAPLKLPEKLLKKLEDVKKAWTGRAIR